MLRHPSSDQTRRLAGAETQEIKICLHGLLSPPTLTALDRGSLHAEYVIVASMHSFVGVIISS